MDIYVCVYLKAVGINKSNCTYVATGKFPRVQIHCLRELAVIKNLAMYYKIMYNCKKM